jgi:hypothetical protein
VDGDDLLDGCDLDFTDDVEVDDDDLDGLVLFADLDPSDERAVDRRRHEWDVLLSGTGR